MINRPPTSSLRARLLGLAASGLVIASVMLVPATALAGPGTPPDPHPDTITTLEDVPAMGNVLDNDENPGEGTLVVVAVGALSPTVGTLVIAPDGDYTFTPAANWTGTASTTYSVANDKHTRSAAIDIIVASVPEPPVANDETVTVAEDTATNVTSAILANDTDGDGDTLSVTGVSGASGGSVVLTAGVVTFTPDENLCGSAAGGFDYTVSDGHGGSDAAHATVDVTCVNDKPHAVNDSASGTEDLPVSVSQADMVGNDTDVEGDTLTVTAVSNATGGSANLASGDVTFNPTPDLCGNNVAGYDYTVSDGHGGTDTGHVTISLACTADAPVANDDTLTVGEDSADSDVTGDLLANDTDADGDSLTVTSVDNAAGGSVDLIADAVTFTPDANLCGDGAAGFDYTIDDGDGGTDSAHATVDVTCDDDAPVAVDDDASGTEDLPVSVSQADMVGNDTDVEGDTLTVTAVSNATGGTADLDAGDVTFTPAENLCGDDAAGYDYTVSDGHGGTDTGHVTIDLACENDNPEAVDDSASGTEDTAVVIDPADLLGNDTDVDGDTISVTGVSNPVGGTAVLIAGTITFTPDADLCGDGAGGFDYSISDGNGGTDGAAVMIDLSCENDDPVAVDDSASGTEDTDVVTAAADLASNDTDADGDTLTVTGVSNETGGSATLDAGDVTFTPDADLCGDGAGGYDYTVDDGSGGSDTGHVTVDLACENDDPVANADTVMVDENTADNDVTADILSNDSDIDGDTLAVSAVANATGGTADLTAGVVTFTPTADLCGSGEGGFDYDLSDGNGGIDAAHVTVNINCVANDPPVATDDAVLGSEDNELAIATSLLLGNDNDPNLGDTLTVSAVGNPAGGSVELDGNEVTFLPDADLCGDPAASFDYTLDDGHGGSDTGTVTIELECVNDAPVGVDDTATIAQASAAADYPVLDNDTDTDGDTLSVTLVSVSPPGAGTVTIDGDEVHFAPAPSFNGTAVITYTLSDGDKTDQATLTITVTPEAVPPVATAPTVRFGTGRVDQTAPLVISWSAVDALSGIAGYEVQVSVGGGAFKPVYTGPATSVQKFYPFKKSLVWRVRATDGEGNTSGWVASASRKLKTFQNSNQKVDYTGVWKGVGDSRASGAGWNWSATFHAKAKLQFKGRAVLYVTTRMKPAGTVKVIVDGHLIGRYNLHAKHTKFGKIVARWSASANATHRIRIVNVTDGKRITFDAFVVLK